MEKSVARCLLQQAYARIDELRAALQYIAENYDLDDVAKIGPEDKPGEAKTDLEYVRSVIGPTIYAVRKKPEDHFEHDEGESK
jgi:hypothetical protein